MSISRRVLWVLGCCLLGSALLTGCWGGPSVATLEIVTVEPPPGLAFGTQGPRIERVSQTELSIFFSQYEDDPRMPDDVLERYLTDPALMSAQAAAAYYGATGQVDPDVPEPSLSYFNIVGRAVDDTMNQMRDPAVAEDPAYRGWRWANALSFLEEAYYGTDHGGTQEEAGRESRDHMRGAI